MFYYSQISPYNIFQFVQLSISVMTLLKEHSARDWRARVCCSLGETLPCTQMEPGEGKIRFGCNVLQVPITSIPLGVSIWGNHLVRGWSKLWWHDSGPSLGMSPRPSAIVRCVALVQRLILPTYLPTVKRSKLLCASKKLSPLEFGGP